MDGYFYLGYFSSSTHFDLVLRLAQKAWRQCVLVFVRELGFRDGNCIGLLANTDLFLSTDNMYLFLVHWSSQTDSCPWGSLFLDALLGVGDSEGGAVFGVGNCTCLLSSTAFLLSTFSKRLVKPLRLVTTAPVSILSFLASKFRNRSFWSELLYTIVFNFW